MKTIHAFVGIVSLKHGVQNPDFACGTGRSGAQGTSGYVDLESITCGPCVAAVTGAITEHGRSVLVGVIASRVAADRQVVRLRKFFEGAAADARRVIVSALDDFDRDVMGRLTDVGGVWPFGSLTCDVAASAMRAPGFIATNTNHAVLTRAAAKLDAAVVAVRAEVFAECGVVRERW